MRWTPWIAGSVAAALMAGCGGEGRRNNNPSGTGAESGAMADAGAGDTTMGQGDSVAGSSASTALSSADRSFVTKTAMANSYELKSAELAQSLSTNPDYKSYAQQIITDHTKVGNELKAAVTEADPSVQLPMTADPKGQSRLDALQKAGKNFDKEYKQQMIKSHEEIHASFADYIGNAGANAGVKTVISGAQPTVEMHLSMAKKLPTK